MRGLVVSLWTFVEDEVRDAHSPAGEVRDPSVAVDGDSFLSKPLALIGCPGIIPSRTDDSSAVDHAEPRNITARCGKGRQGVTDLSGGASKAQGFRNVSVRRQASLRNLLDDLIRTLMKARAHDPGRAVAFGVVRHGSGSEKLGGRAANRVEMYSRNRCPAGWNCIPATGV